MEEFVPYLLDRYVGLFPMTNIDLYSSPFINEVFYIWGPL